MASLIVLTHGNKSDDAYLNIPDEYIVFNDESALTKKQNLQSKQYNDFIHTLYKNDADNLLKFENRYEEAIGSDTFNRHKRQVLIRPSFLYPQNPYTILRALQLQ